MAEMDIVPYIGTRTPADFDTLFDELEAARGSSASLSDAIAEKADNATTLSGYGITDAYTKTEIDTALSGKQNELSQPQLAAANSGITAEKLTADETALGEVINGGAAGTKNLAPISTIQKTTTTAHYTSIIPCYFKAGTYHIKFGYTTVQVATFVLRNKEGTTLLNLPANIPKGTGTYNANFTISEDCYGYHIYGENAAELTDIMICRKTLYDVNPDYEPYAPAKTNVEITPALVEVVDNGAKNLLKFELLSNSNRNGVDYTLNSDGSVTVNGTPSGTAPSYVTLMIDETTAYDAAEFCDGKHIISGCPSGGGSSSYRIQVAKSRYVAYDYGSGAVLTPTTLTGVAILIYIPNGVTVNNLVFRPMICTKAAWDISHAFVPYCPPMQEMYQMILALQSGTRSAPALAMAEPEEVEPETGEEEMR